MYVYFARRRDVLRYRFEVAGNDSEELHQAEELLPVALMRFTGPVLCIEQPRDMVLIDRIVSFQIIIIFFFE